MWNVTVRTLGLQGVSEGRRRRVLFLSPCDGGGFSEVPFLPGMGEARAVGSHLTESPDEVSDFFYCSSFSMDGAVQSKEKSFPKTTVGWRWWEEEVGIFSLLILEDQATEHQGGSQGSSRT